MGFGLLPEFGFIALLAAAVLSVLQGILPWAGLISGRGELIVAARPLAVGACILFFAALGCLAISLATNDFSVAYVAQHSNSRLPVFFKVAAAWGGHEGSMLFFVFTLSLWGASVSGVSERESSIAVFHILSVLGIIVAAFALFIIFASNPFTRQFPPPFEGRDLNPMLQDVALIFHPPLLYIGYAGFAVSFAGAVAALLMRRLDGALAHLCRVWTLAAWVFLSAGIALGAWWAYYELGWGGWWFWDPVENASLMPWLLGTALLHALSAYERRGVFGVTVLLLSIFTFSFSLIGTFIVRSGILSSVHAFANDPGRGMALLLIVCVLLGVVLSLFAMRGDISRSEAEFDYISKESALAATAAILCVMMACVLIGTFYPLIYNLLGWGSISVGAPYFNRVFTPLCMLLLLLLPFAPGLRWQEMSTQWARAQLPWLLVGCSVGAWLCLRHPFPPSVFPVVLSMLAGWAAASHIGYFIRERGIYRVGVHLSHIGVAVAVIGAVQVGYYTDERWLAMTKGEVYPLAGLSFVLEESEPLVGSNYTAEQLVIRVKQDDKPLAVLRPERRYYTVRAMNMSEPGVVSGGLRDFYATFNDKLEGGAYSVHLQHKPMASWLWLGAMLMVLGGLFRLAHNRLATSRLSLLSQDG